MSDSVSPESNAASREDAALERFRPYLRLIAQTNLGSVLRQKVDASDIVQQTMMQAYEHHDDFRGTTDAELMAWLRQILRNRLIDYARHWRGAKRDARRDRAIERAIDESIMRADDWLALSQTSPSQKAINNEELLRLPTALSELPDELREVIVLHHLQGMKFSQIATRIDCDETTVARRLHRGLKQLKQAMEGTP